MKSKSKYGAKKTIVDGIKFDSALEARRYKYLKAMEGSQVFDLELQPEFIIVPSFKLDGGTVRGMKYTADFKYKNISGDTIIEDAKGFMTESYKLRKKLFLWTYCREGKYKFFEVFTAGDTKTLY